MKQKGYLIGQHLRYSSSGLILANWGKNKNIAEAFHCHGKNSCRLVAVDAIRIQQGIFNA